MSKGNQFWAADVTVVATTEAVRLGTRRLQTVDEVLAGVGSNAQEGEREWVYVFNDDGTNSWAAGNSIVRDTDENEWDGIRADAAPVTSKLRVLGLAQFVVAGGSYAFIGRQGPFEAMSDGSVNADEYIVATNNTGPGRCAGTKVGSTIAGHIGYPQEAQTSSGALFTCLLDLS